MFGEMCMDRSVREYVRFVADDAAVDGIDIFCCDKTSGRGERFDLYEHGLAPDLKQGYSLSRLYEVDPFTDVVMRESLAGGADSFELATDPRLAGVGSQADRYWRFMSEQGVDIVGAATRRLLPGFYLVVGLHRVKAKGDRPDLALDRVTHHLTTIKDRMSSAILTRVLASSDGYGQLRRSIGVVSAFDESPMPAFSPRETEIARLICAGKQNKEIAYLTGLSVHTIENHLKRIFRKARIQNRAALVAKMQGLLH